MDNLKKANEYLKSHLHEVKEDFLPIYHAHSPLNWANDPNGFSYFNDEFHLFFQYHPYKNEWGPMHWGHVKSKDLLHFTTLPIALAPDIDKENHGIFSGTAIEDPNEKGTLLIYYTSHYTVNNDTREETALAISNDGINFKKKGLIIDTNQIPANYSKTDFRDPKIYYENNTYYLLMASNKDGKGSVLVYKGKRRDKFEYSFSIELENMGVQAECPDLIKFDDIYVLIYSAVNKDNSHTARYAILNMDINEGNYSVINDEILDYGSDFYAAQTVKKDNNYYLTAWLSSWKNKWENIETKQGWLGSFALPRKLRVKNNKLIQTPLDSFFNSLGKETSEISDVGALFFSLNDGEKVILKDDNPDHCVEIERINNELNVSLISDYDKIETTIPYFGNEIIIAIDRNSLEFFLPSGITATYSHHFGEGKIISLGVPVTFKSLR